MEKITRVCGLAFSRRSVHPPSHNYKCTGSQEACGGDRQGIPTGCALGNFSVGGTGKHADYEASVQTKNTREC